MEMFENKSIRDISKISAKIFFGVDESLKFAARVGLSLGNKKIRPDFKWVTTDCQDWSTFLLNLLSGVGKQSYIFCWCEAQRQ